jgi:hypothetical protein
MFEWESFTDDPPSASSSSSYAYDGSDSPCSTIESAPRQYIPSWDESREWRVVISRHPLTSLRLKEAFREAEKRYGQIKSIAAFVEKDGFRDGQTIAVLRSMGFSKHDARGTPHAVCYVRDLKKHKPEPKIEPTPLVEPKGWEKELAGFRTRLEYKKSQGRANEADHQELLWYEKQVQQEQNAASSVSVQAIDAEIAALQKQIDELTV